jgi:alpha-D-ribose 1-methylphosphonate 5-triphosphate diphosphatase PhnM
MGVETIKERLHLRIEQADEKVLQVLDELTESLLKAYQPQVLKQQEADKSAAYADHLQPLSRQEMTEEIEEAMDDYERGDYLTLEESSKEAASW